LGTNGDDLLEGTSGDDIICGLGGDDIIEGGAGDDIIRGGAGNDTLEGGVGDDYIRGEAGDDTLRGAVGSDMLFGGSGRDIIYGGEGHDIVVGGDRVGEQQQTDMLYFGDMPTPVFFEELTDAEVEAVDRAVIECMQATSEPYFEGRDTRSKCPGILTSLCRSGASLNNEWQGSFRARSNTVEFICSIAYLAELGELGYLTPYNGTIYGARVDAHSLIEDHILVLYNILTNNIYYEISESTATKLRELAQTINLFASQAYQITVPFYE